ncbi:MAG: GNAT family N-acetyltransferase [Phycisphaerales bacterium]|nr:MAG: GNAT family N-acetyltransferase [Phycisphaerales bacterium]
MAKTLATAEPPKERDTLDWQERYRDKVETPDQAVRRVRDGHRVFVGSGAAEPESLVNALSARLNIDDTEIVHILTLGVAPYAGPQIGSRFRHNAFFIGQNVREAIAQGRADYTPMFLSEIPRLFHTGRHVIDVALIQVSPPDEHGYCSYGVSTDIVKSAAENAKIVIAEVNANAPRALGDCFINVRDLDSLVPCDHPILEAPQGVPDELARRIARHIADLVEDGATLQLGIGTIPDAVLHFLQDRRDLGVHTEMFSDGIINLVEKGVITNARKTIHNGKIIASFVLGSRKLYDFIDNNPMCEFHPTEYTNDPFIIAQNDKMVSINSALEVDLTGQVCADSLGELFYSGIGGQVDFVRGASRSKGGKPIIALPSTAMNEAISRIVPTLKPGAGVVTSRGDVHYVVTEYGAAYLHGRNIRERALALIQIAHPKFRPWLLAEAKARHMVYSDQIEIPIMTPIYPEEFERWVRLKGGSEVFIRPAKLTDEAELREMFYKLSEDSVYHRFFRTIKSMPHGKIQEFLRVDYKADMVILGFTGKTEDADLVAIGCYNLNRQTNLAEVAFLVQDEWQDKGLGTALFQILIEAARAGGIRGFTAEVLADNVPMLRVFHESGLLIESHLEDGVYSLEMSFKRPA